MTQLGLTLTGKRREESIHSPPRVTLCSRDWMLLVAALFALAALNASLYLVPLVRLGFPLDDAWIHQTYARNLSIDGTLAYNPGKPSTGSTAPAWTGLLALGYLLRVSPLLWAYLLGSVFSIGSALLAASLSLRYFGHRGSFWLVGILSFLEWHMAWAALSGMEVTLFTSLTLFYLWLLDSEARPYWLGLVAGLIVLVRPEGLLLVITYGLKWLAMWTTNRRAAIRSAALFLLPFAAIVSPLFAFNWLYGNGPLPQTVSAKYLEYGIPWTLRKSSRYLVGVIKYFVWGPLLLLAPYAAVPIFQAGRTRNQRLVYPLAWMVGLVSLYSVALPHMYHNGRYIMPLIPLVVILGAEGLQWMITTLGHWRLFWPLYKLAVVAMVVALWINGASTYSLQVKLLSESHLAIAEWISERTPVDAVIATHDVGLLGYYGGRELLDLAGLITPEAIPILDDQQALAQLGRSNGVTHLVVFTGYYPTLLQELNARLVFSPDSERLHAMALEPFEVYEVQ